MVDGGQLGAYSPKYGPQQWGSPMLLHSRHISAARFDPLSQWCQPSLAKARQCLPNAASPPRCVAATQVVCQFRSSSRGRSTSAVNGVTS